MTKEELEKEAIFRTKGWKEQENCVQAYLAGAGAEPREKRIADLEQENAELKDYRLSTLKKQQTGIQKYALNLEHKLNWYDDQLVKAKELLKDITSSYGSTEVSEAQLYLKIKKAEQFLRGGR